MNQFEDTDLIILVGGKGSRLKSLTTCPKPLIKFKNKFFLQYLINFYSKYNFNKIYLITSYKSKLFYKFFHKKIINQIEIICVKERVPLDTAGALNAIKNKVLNKFILLNGDSFLNFDISKIKAADHYTLLLIKNLNYSSNTKLSNLSLDTKKKVLIDNSSNYMNAGIYFLNKKIFKYIPKGKKFSLECDLLPILLSKKKIFGRKVDGFFIDIGTPNNLKLAKKVIPKLFSSSIALFDRDGTINYDFKYVHKMRDFKLKPGVVRALKFLTKKKIKIFFITNQSGIARNYYSEKKFINFHKEIKKFFLSKNIIINDVFYCPHHPKGKNYKLKKKCNCRKPKIGMFKQLKERWIINRRKTFMIGDQVSDYNFALKSDIYFEYPSKNFYTQVRNIVKKLSL